MTTTERYINEVLNFIHAPEGQKQRLEEDLRTHFEEALKGGEEAGEVIRKLGNPRDVALSFMSEISFHHAGFWRRVGAFLLDLLVCLNVTVPFLLLIFALFRPDRQEMSPLVFVLFLFFGLGTTGVFLLYFLLLESRFGQTLGKKLFYLWVTSEAGLPIGMGQAIIRRLSMYFDFLWLDALFIPFTEKRQRALDIVARTMVLRDPDSGAGWKAASLAFALTLTLALMTSALVLLEKSS